MPMDDEFDPSALITLDPDQYDPDAFYTATSTSEEGNTPTSIRILNSQVVMISRIVQSAAIPEITQLADFVRDAVCHDLHRIARRMGDPEFMERVNTILALARAEAWRIDMDNKRKLVDTKTELLRMAYDTNDLDALTRILEEADQDLIGLREPYSTDLQKVVGDYRGKLERTQYGR